MNGPHDSFKPSEVVILTRKPKNRYKTNDIVTEIQGDLTDPRSLKNSLEDISVVFHIAALADDWAPWDQLYRVNVKGTANLADAFLKFADGNSWIQVSSAGIYGHYIPNEQVDEDYPPNPTSEYQKSKFLQEEELLHRVDENNFKLGIFRTPSIIGPGDTTTTLPVIRALAKRSFPQVGDGNNLLSFMNVLDLARGMSLAAGNLDRFKIPKIWNIYSFSTTLKEYQSVLCRLLQLPQPKQINFRLAYTAAVLSEIWAKLSGRKTTLNRYRVTKFSKSRVYDMTRVKRDLSYEPHYDLRTSAKAAVEWLIDNDYIESPVGSTVLSIADKKR